MTSTNFVRYILSTVAMLCENKLEKLAVNFKPNRTSLLNLHRCPTQFSCLFLYSSLFRTRNKKTNVNGAEKSLAPSMLSLI